METDLTIKTKNEKLRIALLNAGKNEFLAHGYRAVSIRNIATKAGTTTGAIYVYFENKEGLFHALVKDTAQELLAFWRQMAARSTRIVRNGGGYVYQIPCEDKVWLEKFLYKNQTAIHLLLDCSVGTSYENFSHSLIELETAINELAILLDEATASLDPENEVLVQKAIAKLIEGKTVIMIAHRLRTVVDADQIFVLEKNYSQEKHFR